ncbi:MAG: DUF3726 domain-containing protein [Pseudomonadota bacterium]
MRLSSGEFLALLKRAFEGAGWKHGRYEDAATTTWWLQIHGINWLQYLTERGPRLFESAATVPELLLNTPSRSVLDGMRSSYLHCGAAATDLVYANACIEKLTSVETRNCLDRVMVIPGLVTLARRNASAIARWYSRTCLHVAFIDAGATHPTYQQYLLPPMHESTTQSLFLICSLDNEGVNHYHRSIRSLDQTHTLLRSISPEEFRQTAQTVQTGGIELPAEAINFFNGFGNRVLVEASEQSRQGAG